MTGYQFKEYKHRVNFIQHDRYQNMTGYQVKEHKHRSNFIQHDRYQNMTGYQFKEYKHRVNFIQHDRYQNMTGYQTRTNCSWKASLIKIIPTQFSYRRGLTGMAYRSSSRDLINLNIETKYWPMRFDITKAFSVVRSKWRRLTQPSL